MLSVGIDTHERIHYADTYYFPIGKRMPISNDESGEIHRTVRKYSIYILPLPIHIWITPD